MIVLTLFYSIIILLKYVLEFLLFLFNYNLIIIKILLICGLFFLIWKIYNQPYNKRRKLSFVRDLKYNYYRKYKIHDENELDITISIIILYVLIFVIFLFSYRLKNITRNFDLNYYYEKLTVVYASTSSLSLLFNLLIVVLMLILYIKIFSIFSKFVREQIISLYLYLFLDIFDKFEGALLSFQLKIKYDRLPNKFLNKITLQKNSPQYRWYNDFLYTHLFGLEFVFHRIILILTIIYDIKYNNMILSHMFKILPYVFLYELYIRFCIFIMGLNTDYDRITAYLLYKDIGTFEYDKECLYLNGTEPYEKKTILHVLINYSNKGLVDRENRLQEDPIYEGLNYIYRFWKDLLIVPYLKILSKYKMIDILCFSAITIYLFISSVLGFIIDFCSKL